MTRTARLRTLWLDLNTQFFHGRLAPVPIRITRSRRTYGYYNAPNNGGQPSIRISTVLADTVYLQRDTMLHEMIHQHLHEREHTDWDGHGPDFQAVHVDVFGHHYVEQ